MIDCLDLHKDLHEEKADTFGEVNSIPVNFDECLAQLEYITNNKMKEFIKCLPDGMFSGFLHHGLGMYLRNS